MLSAEEEAEFWVLYRKTSGPLFRKAFRVCRGDKADADDALQNAYLRALQHWPLLTSLDDRQRAAWLARTLVNEVLQLWRARYRAWETTAPGDADMLQFVAVMTAGTEALDEGHRDKYYEVCQAIARLDGRQREVIALRCLAGYETSEVAEMLGIRPSTVRVELKAGRRALQTLLAGKEPAVDG